MNLPSMSGFETSRFRTLTSTCIEYARLEKRRQETIGDTSEFFHRHIAHGRGELGYYGPTYNAAKAATIAPAYFTKTSDEIRDHQTRSKINAAIDLVHNHKNKDKINAVPIGSVAKFTIHCDNRQAKPAVLYVRARTPPRVV